jgi:hypothetical protein
VALLVVLAGCSLLPSDDGATPEPTGDDPTGAAPAR